MTTEKPNFEPVSLSFTSDTASGHGSPNTRLLLNGQNITKFVRGFWLHADVGSVVTAEIEIIPRAGFELVLPTAVFLKVVAVPVGFDLIEERSETETRWRVEPRKQATDGFNPAQFDIDNADEEP